MAPPYASRVQFIQISYISDMASTKRIFLNFLRHMESFSDKFRSQLKKITGWGRQSPLMVTTYRGFGRENFVHLQGRVLKHKPIYGTNHNSRWKSLIDSYRRFETDEIRDAEVAIWIGSQQFDLQTDEEGFFILDGKLQPPVPRSDASVWKTAAIQLKGTPWRRVNLRTEGEFLIPHPRATFGVISDIDDTILQTHVTSLLKLKMLYYTIFKNAAGRRPFRQVSAFYQALHQQELEEAVTPFFYVSNSPWNLYDLLLEFMELNNLPQGPILLRDIGIPKDKPGRGFTGHKHLMIQQILKTYPELPFLLIGDSGERDAEIYLDIARAFPDRIRTIYIRDVRSPRQAEQIARLIRNSTDVDIRLIHNYGEAAEDAAKKGLLTLDSFEHFREKLKQEDRIL